MKNKDLNLIHGTYSDQAGSTGATQSPGRKQYQIERLDRILIPEGSKWKEHSYPFPLTARDFSIPPHDISQLYLFCN